MSELSVHTVVFKAFEYALHGSDTAVLNCIQYCPYNATSPQPTPKKSFVNTHCVQLLIFAVEMHGGNVRQYTARQSRVALRSDKVRDSISCGLKVLTFWRRNYFF